MASREESTIERETLLANNQPKLTGFTHRRVANEAMKKIPRDLINIEMSHHLRTSTTDATHGLPCLEYQLWLEAGKHGPPGPKQPDPNYNSNVWRNFRREFGFHVDSSGHKVSEMIANMYPLNIPPPSRVGDHHFKKFLKEMPVVKDPVRKSQAVKKVEEDLDEFYRLRMHSDLRNPPIDQSGKILPPKHFKKYAPKFIKPEDTEPSREQTSLFDNAPNMRTDIFGQKVPRSKTYGPNMWKVAYKLNNPQYLQVQEEIMRKKRDGTNLRQPGLILPAFESRHRVTPI